MQIQAISLVIGVALPILVAIVTKRSTDPGVKAVLLALLSAASGFLSEWLVALNTSANFDWGSVAVTWVTTFVVGVATHFGLWAPTGVAATVAATVGPTDPVRRRLANPSRTTTDRVVVRDPRPRMLDEPGDKPTWPRNERPQP